MAINSKGKYVKIQDALREDTYYCIECNGRLIPNKGTSRIHYFNHYIEKGKSGLIECELYSYSNADYEILINEQIYENRVRFVIDEFLNIKIKLPSLGRSAFIRMNHDDLYFSVQVQDSRIYSTELGIRNRERYLDVSFEKEYIIEFTNNRHALLLDYEVIDRIKTFTNKTLLFKKIGGEFISTPYSSTNLSDDFFVISTFPLADHENLIIKNHAISNGIYIYHFFIEFLTDSLISWFKKETNYTVIPNRKWIDLIYPNSYQYSEKSMLIEGEKVILKVTPNTIVDHVFYVNTKDEKIVLEVDGDGYVELDLELNHSYTFRLNHAVCNEITVTRVKEILTVSNFPLNVLINKKISIMKTTSFDKPFSIESDRYFQVFYTNEYPFQTKSFENRIPEFLHYPFIGTMYKGKTLDLSGKIDWDSLISTNQYSVVKNSEFIRVLNALKKSTSPNKKILIAYLLRNYNKLPIELIKVLRERIIK